MATWRALHDIADKLEPAMRREFLRAVQRLRAAIDVNALGRAIASGDLRRVDRLLAGLPSTLTGAVNVMRRGFDQAAAVEASAVSVGSGTTLRFDKTNPFAVRDAERYAARMVRQVSEETRRAVRQVIARAQLEQITPRDTAKLVRELVGLTRFQARQVTRRRFQWFAMGLSPAAVDENVGRLRNKLLRERSITIARTELINTTNGGQLALWQQLRRDGLVRDPKKTWITTPDDRRCRWCLALDGVTVPLDKPFVSAYHGKKQGPTLHPRCRCALGMVA